MTGTTKVSPAEVLTLSEDIKTKSGQIEGHLGDLDRKVAALKANWDGEAKEAYERAQREWSVQITEMNALLARVSGKLVEISNDYGATDRRGAGRFVL
jgi:early secretory antigenic target protein ESAT-6